MRILPSLLLLFFSIGNGGCMTVAMWEDANSPVTAIQGVSATSPGGRSCWFAISMRMSDRRWRFRWMPIALADLPHRWQKEADRQPLEGDLRREPAMFAVVPATRPRPEADRQRAQFTAAVLTPLTIPGDALFLAGVVVIYPPVWLYVQIFWPNGGC